MPIRPENKDRYPANWKSEIRPRILERAGNRCETCGIRNHQWVIRDQSGKIIWEGSEPIDPQRLTVEEVVYLSTHKARQKYQPGFGYGYHCVRIVLTVAHISEEIEDCSDGNLILECQWDHNNRDRSMRARNAKETLRAKRSHGQLSLGGATCP